LGAIARPRGLLSPFATRSAASNGSADTAVITRHFDTKVWFNMFSLPGANANLAEASLASVFCILSGVLFCLWVIVHNEAMAWKDIHCPS